MLAEIIRMFKEKGDFLSGEEISRELGITRAAVWKKIKQLREKGYTIQAFSSKGYKLVKTPEFSPEELATLIGGDFGRKIVFREKVDSTNVVAMGLADNASPHGTVVIANSQTKGKGRLGRSWVSPPKGNVYMSIILRPGMVPKGATLLTIMAAIACALAIRNTTGVKVDIKWPNDLTVSGMKLGGILTEMKSDPDRIVFAVIGIGLNVNISNKDLPPDIRPIATSIRNASGRTQSRTIIIAEILREMEKWYKVLIKDGRRALLEEWKRLSSTLGRDVMVATGKEVLTGNAEDIDEDGMLIVKLPSGARKKISAGDLTLLR